MRLVKWLGARSGIAHRAAAERAVGVREIRAAIERGEVRRVRRAWLALPEAPPDLVAAADAGGRLTCVSLARRRGWWMPDDAPADLHVHLQPAQASPRGRIGTAHVLHWTKPIAPGPSDLPEASVEDALMHMAHCLEPESCLVVWESAIRVEGLSVDAIRNVRWPSLAARACAARVQGLSDSGLETIVVARLRPWGIPIRQQVVIGGRPVDLLIGRRLVVQIDGFAHHSTPQQRRRDVEQDAELRLRGYTVLRFTYAQVLYDWPSVERAIARAIAAGAHL